MAKNKLLLLHGALGSQIDFSELKSILSDREIYTFNLSGHGGNEFNTDFSIDQFVNETRDFIEQHNLSPVNLFGYSMGGYVVLKLALTHPHLVNKIITLGTKFHWSKDSVEKQVRTMNPELIEQKVPKFAETLRTKHARQDWKILMQKTADLMTDLGDGAAMTKDDFSKIQHEVLISVGSEDTMVTQEESAQVASYLKNGKLKIIEGFKHPIDVVDKGKLAEIVNEFFNP